MRSSMATKSAKNNQGVKGSPTVIINTSSNVEPKQSARLKEGIDGGDVDLLGGGLLGREIVFGPSFARPSYKKHETEVIGGPYQNSPKVGLNSQKESEPKKRKWVSFVAATGGFSCQALGSFLGLLNIRDSCGQCVDKRGFASIRGLVITAVFELLVLEEMLSRGSTCKQNGSTDLYSGRLLHSPVLPSAGGTATLLTS
ncbi:hypothetical protein L6452_21621 [Arctium lappa]|uniref:Uncharacterized protein n=1 Tax=Arctium lappa TaxID=4217 RepID=A0ACB9AZ77_ARCLA|nr:hypothetical protein L6452_21621 [Arctium lappa]